MTKQDSTEADCLIIGAAQLGISLTDQQIYQYKIYCDLLLEWNSRINLTAILDRQQVFLRHFLDALSISLGMSEELRASPLQLLDIGAGAGLPGLALKIAFPHWHVTEVDSIGKKTNFMSAVVDELALENVRIFTARAEDLARQRDHRDSYDVTVARGVAPLAVLLEYLLPLCAVDGLAIMPKKGEMADEISSALYATEQMGAILQPARCVPKTLGLGEDRILIIATKLKSTPRTFPRPSGMAKKYPLGSERSASRLS